VPRRDSDAQGGTRVVVVALIARCYGTYARPRWAHAVPDSSKATISPAPQPCGFEVWGADGL
jgi:hypothetical protein